MSLPHATRPKEGASPRSTRQLLDELDALMDQMLALPVEDEPAELPPPTVPPALAATLTMIEPDLDKTPFAVTNTTPDLPKAFASGRMQQIRDVDGESDTPPWTKEHIETETEDNVRTPEETFALVDLNDEAATDALLAPVNPMPLPTHTAPPRAPARPMPRSSASWAFGTLVVWDRAFRRMTRRLGPFGWLLRSAGGRIILGTLGLAFWIVSLVWLVSDWLRWSR